MKLRRRDGGVEGCEALERWCRCGVVACRAHGYTAPGDDVYCPYLRLGPVEEPPPPGVVEDIDLSA